MPAYHPWPYQFPKPWAGASVHHQHPGYWHNLSRGLKQKQAGRCTAPAVPLALLALQPKPCGGGSWLTFSLHSNKLSHGTVMTFCLQRDLWAPAHGFYLQLVTRCGWYRRHARVWGLGWNCQYPLLLETTSIHTCLWRDPHQLKVAPLSCPLLCQHHKVRRTWARGYPHTTSTCYSHPISLQCAECQGITGPS